MGPARRSKEKVIQIAKGEDRGFLCLTDKGNVYKVWYSIPVSDFVWEKMALPKELKQ